MAMTTPRDDIAGLSERLRAKAEKAGREWSYYPLVTEAAAQLDALSARVKELEAFASSESRAANKLLGDGLSLIDRLEAAEAHALRAEQERDEAAELIRPLAILAEDSAALLSKHNSKFAPDIASLALRARAFSRRLAPGPEKEKKE